MDGCPHVDRAEQNDRLVANAERAPGLLITRDLGLGMMLSMTHMVPDEEWARIQRSRCLSRLEGMRQQDGYYCREPDGPEVKFGFTNYGVSIGLQAVGEMPRRVQRLKEFFDGFRSGDEYDRDAIKHVMSYNSHFPGYFLRDFRGLIHQPATKYPAKTDRYEDRHEQTQNPA